MLKDLDKSVFKRETLQMKQAPQKPSPLDKSKLSRQINALKKTLKDTTENTMQLDSSIENRQ